MFSASVTRASPLSLYWLITTGPPWWQAEAEVEVEAEVEGEGRELEEVEWDLLSFLQSEWWDLLDTGVLEVVTLDTGVLEVVTLGEVSPRTGDLC